MSEENQDGYEQEMAEYETHLAGYLQARIKPGLSRSAIPLLARSIAKDIARREPPEPEGERSVGQPPDFEADMHELQSELGEDWILRFSVHREDGWLTAEKADASQRAEAPDAERLVKIVAAINEGGGRRR
jgi:hypothetical protein